MKQFVNDLKTALKNYLDPYLDEDVFLDTERLQPGYFYNEELAYALCKSIALIVVYSPKYEQHTYCLREFHAMELLQQERFNAAKISNNKRGIIYPIILRGKLEDLPDKISQKIQCCDFSKFSLCSLEISKNPDYIQEIEKIAADIHQHYESFKNIQSIVDKDCDSFSLPSEKESRSSWKSCRKSNPFPGRTN